MTRQERRSKEQYGSRSQTESRIQGLLTAGLILAALATPSLVTREQSANLSDVLAPTRTQLVAAEKSNVTRATLDNGLRVVIVRDPIAPAVTIEDNYLVGADETPEGFPGMAHAQEHMASRGCSGLTADEISAVFAQMGGVGNAYTDQSITQYASTVPAADLEIALRVDAACMWDIQDSQTEWAHTRATRFVA